MNCGPARTKAAKHRNRGDGSRTGRPAGSAGERDRTCDPPGADDVRLCLHPPPPGRGARRCGPNRSPAGSILLFLAVEQGAG
ncbi:MAG TPA: hypothetical protein PLR27_06460 [Methanoregulaceae archaeon]|nr:hypothetical protein [Methanoregulaceae archaeon]